MTRPGFHFLLSHPAHLLAFGMGSGLAPVAPGTFGTLFAWASYPVIKSQFADFAFLGFLAIAFAVGIVACERTGRDLGVMDHGAIVWDEIVPFWLVLLFAPSHWLWQATAFALFRFFDIVKPQPARWVDGHMKSGFGVMLDDVFAALYTLLSLAVLRQVLD